MIFACQKSCSFIPTMFTLISKAFLRFYFISTLFLQSGSCDFLGTAKKDTLQLVQVIFRHGDRAPTYTYPKDPYIETSTHWPEGLAQLTNRGKMQQYELGRYLRHRYDGYLGKKYSQAELYVTSSDMDRTIMSLESNLAGLFPPVNHWNPKIEWQPIPLRTIPWKDDKYLHNNVKCPRYYEIRREFYTSSDIVRKMNEQHSEFIRYCAEHSGIPATTVKELYPLLDVLYAQASHNFTLPPWAQGNTLPKLLEIYSVVNTWSTYTPEMKRLWGGPLLNLLIKNMQAIAGHLGSNPDDAHSVSHGVNRKMLMYSAHDSTLARIMNTMGVFEPHCPPYAAALFVELHQDTQSQEYFVEIHYRNDTRHEPYQLVHPLCGHPCKLQTLMEISSPLIPTDWQKECNVQEATKAYNFFLKMHEHDNEIEPEAVTISEDDGLLRSSWFDFVDGDDQDGCSPSVIQLVLMGIGLIAASAIVAFVIVKVVQWPNSNDSGLGYYETDELNGSSRRSAVSARISGGITIRIRTWFAGWRQSKLGGSGRRTYYRVAYEQL